MEETPEKVYSAICDIRKTHCAIFWQTFENQKKKRTKVWTSVLTGWFTTYYQTKKKVFFVKFKESFNFNLI